MLVGKNMVIYVKISVIGFRVKRVCLIIERVIIIVFKIVYNGFYLFVKVSIYVCICVI